MEKDFGLIVKRILGFYSISQTELANKLGISLARLNNYVKGRNYPPFEIFVKMADVLGLTLDQLAGRTEVGTKYGQVDIIPLLTFFDSQKQLMEGCRKTVLPIYRGISDVQALTQPGVFDYINRSTFCPSSSAKYDAYSLVLPDDSMNPVFARGDLVMIDKHDINLKDVKDLEEVYAVRLDESDTVGLALRKVIVRGDLTILVPNNLEFATATVKGFNPVVGRPASVYRNLKNYNIR